MASERLLLALLLALLVLVVLVLVPGCTGQAVPTDHVVPSAVPNLTYAANATHMTMTYVPDGTETRVAITPVWTGQYRYSEVGIPAEFADPSRPAVYVEQRGGCSPAHHLILIARPSGTIQYRDMTPAWEEN